MAKTNIAGGTITWRNNAVPTLLAIHLSGERHKEDVITLKWPIQSTSAKQSATLMWSRIVWSLRIFRYHRILLVWSDFRFCQHQSHFRRSSSDTYTLWMAEIVLWMRPHLVRSNQANISYWLVTSKVVHFWRILRYWTFHPLWLHFLGDWPKSLVKTDCLISIFWATPLLIRTIQWRPTDFLSCSGLRRSEDDHASGYRLWSRGNRYESMPEHPAYTRQSHRSGSVGAQCFQPQRWRVNDWVYVFGSEKK